jgi:hypothetical protein
VYLTLNIISPPKVVTQLPKPNKDLSNALQTVVAYHHPREMETAINLARTLEHLPPTTIDAERATPNVDTNSNHTPGRKADIPNNETDWKLALPSPAFGYNTRAATYIHNDIGHTILA